MSHWSSGLPVCFPLWGTRVQSPGGYFCVTGILLLALSRYIGDPDVIDHRLRWASSQTITRPSCRECDNPTWSHTALLSRFHARCRSSFRLHNRHSQLLRGEPCGESAISLHSYHALLVQWTTRLLLFPRVLGSIPRELLMWNRDSPVSVVSLHDHELGYCITCGKNLKNCFLFIMYFGLQEAKPPPCPLLLTKQGGLIQCIVFISIQTCYMILHTYRYHQIYIVTLRENI
jgi:hypothetical protein